MYGVESAVHPDYRGHGVGGQLMDARFRTLKLLNLKGMVAGSLFMDYWKYADTCTQAEYVQAVVEGRVFDTNLSKQLHKGFRVHNLIPDYVYDPRTGNYAVCIVWENPDYDPAYGPQPSAPRTIPVAFDLPASPERAAFPPPTAAAVAARMPTVQPAPPVPFATVSAAGS
jgi:hypothetical protein